jgi:hypothetical protein
LTELGLSASEDFTLILAVSEIRPHLEPLEQRAKPSLLQSVAVRHSTPPGSSSTHLQVVEQASAVQHIGQRLSLWSPARPTRRAQASLWPTNLCVHPARLCHSGHCTFLYLHPWSRGAVSSSPYTLPVATLLRFAGSLHTRALVLGPLSGQQPTTGRSTQQCTALTRPPANCSVHTHTHTHTHTQRRLPAMTNANRSHCTTSNVYPTNFQSSPFTTPPQICHDRANVRWLAMSETESLYHWRSVSETVRLGSDPLQESWSDFYCSQGSRVFVGRGASSLPRRRFVLVRGHSLCPCQRYIHMYILICFLVAVVSVHSNAVSPGFVQQIMPSAYILPMYKQQLRCLKFPMPDSHHVSAVYIFCVGLRFGLCWEHLLLHNFVRLWCNNVHTEFWTPARVGMRLVKVPVMRRNVL